MTIIIIIFCQDQKNSIFPSSYQVKNQSILESLSFLNVNIQITTVNRKINFTVKFLFINAPVIC